MDKETYDNYLLQKDLQQQNIDAQTGLNAPALYEQVSQSQAVLVEQTNPRKIVKEIILRLRGLEQKSDGTYVRVADPKMNESGIDNIWFILDSHINDTVRFSHLTDKEISKLMAGVGDAIVDDLALNWKEYGIKKKTDLDTINNSILYNVFQVLKRAEGQNEKNWLGKISVENISAASRIPQPKKEGFLSKFRL